MMVFAGCDPRKWWCLMVVILEKWCFLVVVIQKNDGFWSFWWSRWLETRVVRIETERLPILWPTRGQLGFDKQISLIQEETWQKRESLETMESREWCHQQGSCFHFEKLLKDSYNLSDRQPDIRVLGTTHNMWERRRKWDVSRLPPVLDYL